MKHYTSIIPLPLAEKLKEKGMLMEESRYGIFPHFVAKDGVMYFPPTFASTFDWLMSEKGKEIEIFYVPARGAYMYGIAPFPDYQIGGNTWHEAANTAIEKALELI